MTQWVLLRGLARDSRHWGDFPATLRAALPGAQLHLVDLPGNGRFCGVPSPISVEAMAHDCRYQLSRRGLKAPFNVIGLSLGGMVAVAWAQAHPAEVAGCVLVNTSLRPFSTFKQRLRPVNYRSLLKMAFGLMSDAQCEATVMRLTSRLVAADAARSERQLAEWLRWRREWPVSSLNAARQLIAAARFQAPPAPPVPEVLVLASAQDALVDSRCSRQLAEAWGCGIALHPEAGHDLPLDDGHWLAEQVAQWAVPRLSESESDFAVFQEPLRRRTA